MFKIIIQILLLIYIAIVLQMNIDIQKYNANGFIIETSENRVLQDNYNKLNPIHTKHIINIDLEDNNLNYLQDIINYRSNKESYVFKNLELLPRLINENDLFNVSFFEDSHYYFPISKTITIISGINSIPLKKCIHNHNIIGVLDGSSIFYLFNPKHKDEIINKENDKIKKWGHKINLSKNDVLIIPPNWSYIQEIEKKTIQYHIDVDTYFTFIPNYIKGIIRDY